MGGGYGIRNASTLQYLIQSLNHTHIMVEYRYGVSPQANAMLAPHKGSNKQQSD